ncbi:hypothetical protein EDB87DRAFT_436344 [Lactarius vividus]|nr:hypothetical protein EDB87DRAFT_436344 [Lactarius vividus]
MSLHRTPPPLQSKKRKVNDLESTEEDEASVTRKIKIMNPEPTQSATRSPSYRLLDHDHSIRLKAVPPPQLPENNLTAVAAVNYPLHNIPVNRALTQQPTPQPQPQAYTQTPSHPQSQSQSQFQPQSWFQSQPPPQRPPPPPLQPPRSIPTPVVAAPSILGSADTKKYTPKPAAKRTQTPGDGTLDTLTSSATPVQATPQPAQHLRATNRPTSRPTSHSPHPIAVVNGSANTLGSSPRVAPSPTLHAMAVAATNAASSSSPRPPAQSAIQPQQGQPQPQPQPQAVPQARAPFLSTSEGLWTRLKLI